MRCHLLSICETINNIRILLIIMSSFSVQLMKKVKAVLNDYKSFVSFGKDDFPVDEKYLEIFSSMKRWHVNCHITPVDWKESFDRIKHGLDVRGKMRPLGDLKSFLDIKFKAEVHQNRFNICEILEFLENDIRHLYRLKLDFRDGEFDEFNTSQIYQGMLPEDTTFYERVFLPTALFLTYSQRHPNSDRESLMNDCFTLGAGTKRDDLAPEVTGLCMMCSEHEGFKSLSEIDIEYFNKQVLMKQIASNFNCSYSMGESDLSDESYSNKDKSTFWYNPFSSSESSITSEEPPTHDDDDRIEVGFTCSKCSKEFSKHEFVEFHKACFHKTSDTTTVRFVEEAEELMTTFNEEPGPSSEPDLVMSKDSATASSSKRVKLDIKEKSKPTSSPQQTRKGVRKSLRFHDK